MSINLYFIGYIHGNSHFKSVDGNFFDFMGIGEFLMLESSENNLTIQTRFTTFRPNSSAAVMIGAVFKQGSALTVQLESQDSVLKLYVDGVHHPLPSSGTTYVISDEINSNFTDTQSNRLSDLSADLILIRRIDDQSLLIVTSSGATMQLRRLNFFMNMEGELPCTFINKTRGLIGVFNRDHHDDYMRPDGTFLTNPNDRDIYYLFGSEC